MATLASYLRRFGRFVSPPGRPGRAAVPADRSNELADELGDVFAAIDDIGQEAAHIRDDALQLAEVRRRHGRDEADRILDQAREHAVEQRAAVATVHRAQIEDVVRSALDAADREAAGIRRRAHDRMDEMADGIVRTILRSSADADLERIG
jgi:ElaB/YqjD/DUF883 family membrane-anchored ribosome-binding protein